MSLALDSGELGATAVKLTIPLARAAGSHFLANRVVARLTKTARRPIRHLRERSLVKTILNPHQGSSLLKIYCPTYVSDIGAPVTTFDDLRFWRRRAVVQARAGQGKSTLLRFLQCSELYRKNYFPILVELGNIDDETSLQSLIRHELKSFGLGDVGERSLDRVLKRCKVVLLLDAFDEVPESHKRQLLQELEALAGTYEAVRILVTTRPGEIVSRYGFVYQIQEYRQSEYRDIVPTFVEDQEKVNAILSGVGKSRSLRELLTTPIMIAILCVHYDETLELPENERQFFDELFSVLYRRHYRDKPSMRGTGFVDQEIPLRYFLDSLSWRTREVARRGRSTSNRIHDVALQNAALKAADETGVDVTEGLAKLERITAFIQKEGGSWAYIHKSIQEFYSASYIYRYNDIQKAGFYNNCRESWLFWEQELRYLSVLDPYMWAREFGLSEMEKLANAIRSVRESAHLKVVELIPDFRVYVRWKDARQFGVDDTQAFQTADPIQWSGGGSTDSWWLSPAGGNLVDLFGRSVTKNMRGVKRFVTREFVSRERERVGADLVEELSIDSLVRIGSFEKAVGAAVLELEASLEPVRARLKTLVDCTGT